MPSKYVLYPEQKNQYLQQIYVYSIIYIWCKYLAYMSCRIPNLLLQWLNDFSSGHQNTIKDGRREFLLATQLLLLLPISTLLRMRSPRHLATSSHGHRITQSPIVWGGAPQKKTCARFGTKKNGRNKCITKNWGPPIQSNSLSWFPPLFSSCPMDFCRTLEFETHVDDPWRSLTVADLFMAGLDNYLAFQIHPNSLSASIYKRKRTQIGNMYA